MSPLEVTSEDERRAINIIHTHEGASQLVSTDLDLAQQNSHVLLSHLLTLKVSLVVKKTM